MPRSDVDRTVTNCGHARKRVANASIVDISDLTPIFRDQSVRSH